MSFGKLIKHLNTITHHRNLVMKYCFKCGLYKQGLLHDLSKYSFVELSTGAKYYQGDKSPNGVEKKEKGYSKAWLHHKGRNKHHLEYWIDYSEDKDKGFEGMKMPVNYVVEMMCDRIAACRTYQKDAYTDSSPLDYFNKGLHKYKDMFNAKSCELIKHLLTYLKDNGEENTFAYVRNEILTGKADIVKDYQE